MEGKQKHDRKNAKSWPKTNRNYPTRQLWKNAKLSRARSHKIRQNVNKQRHLCRWYACLSRTSENATICRNINNPPKQYQQCAVLSRTESRNLIGQKINKVSCNPSASQKVKHVPTKGRRIFNSKILNSKLQKSEVSQGNIQREKLDKIRDENLVSLGLEAPSKWCPQKSTPSRSAGPSKVKNSENGK